MKVWYNKIHDSRRTMVEIADPVIRIGRELSNTIVLSSPLVSKRHAIVTQQNGKLRLENVGINGCMVGEVEVLGGQSLEFTPGQQVRIWPFSLTFEAETASVITRLQLEAHLRSIMADLELRARLHPTDIDTAAALCLALAKEDRVEQALARLQALHEVKGYPDYIRNLEAELWERKAEWGKAWSALRPFVSG